MVARSHFLAAAILAAVMLAVLLLGAVPVARTAESAPSPAQIQAFDLGDRQLYYSGDTALQVESGSYWDIPLASGQAVVGIDTNGHHLLIEPGPTDDVRFIIQLNGEPLAVHGVSLETAGAAQGYAASLRTAQADVLGDLAARGIPLRVHRQYVYAYNGLAVTARAGDREAIAQTPGVRAVYPDYQMQPLLPESVPLVGVPGVWAMEDADGQAVTGGGVRVAVIDSGIDYDHPDLGGPGFPNSRVITGYNFVSDTIDPWDDIGHGTHVAGIVAASGQITGVAPASSLMAFKVVDAALGSAQTSDTIAAIERALDPDGDPGSDDVARVINLSLGSPGHPDDPLSQVCDNAVLAGALVVVAAGNSGPFYQSLTSPGLARRVTSVGAASKTDTLWSGSSRGPVPSSWAIKPDLVAPGVSISSTIPGYSWTTGTGTSAATAHVAGAAVLLRQLRPSWSPESVQAALMNTALDLGLSPYEQGAGRLRVDKAATTPVLILPPSLSLGRVDDGLPLWTREEVLVVHNVSTGTVTYSLSITGSLPSGVSVEVSPTMTIVSPGALSDAAFTLTVDTAAVPDPGGGSSAYWGALLATVDGSPVPDLRVPFAFVKAPLLRLHVDETPVSVMFLRRDGSLESRFAAPTTTTSEHLLPAGDYDVVVQYQRPYAYVLQTVELTRTAEITLPRAAAVHEVRIAFDGEHGQPVVPNHAFHRFSRDGNGWLVPESAPIAEIFYFSDVPASYLWERTVADADPGSDAYRQWHGRAEGISGDLAFLTEPADFARVDHPLRPMPGVTEFNFWEQIGYATPLYSYMVRPSVPAVSLPYTRRAYYRQPPLGHGLYMQRAVIPEPVPGLFDDSLTSPWLQLDAERHLTWGLPLDPASAFHRVPTGGVEPLGLGPIHWFTQFTMDGPDSVRLTPAEGSYLFFRAYQGGDVSWELRQPYELQRGDTLVQTGDLGPYTGGSQVTLYLPEPGAYSMTLPFTYTLGATAVVTGQGRVVAEFDTGQHTVDASLPFLKSLRLLDAWRGQPVDVTASAVDLRLRVADEVDTTPSVDVAYNVGTGWMPVAVGQESGVYGAQLPAFPSGTDVHLRVALADDAGNRLVHYLEPAYLVRGQVLYLPLVLQSD